MGEIDLPVLNNCSNRSTKHHAKTSVKFAVTCASLLVSSNSIGAAYELGKFEKFEGTCDASAAVAIDKDHFVVASDENSVLRLFSSYGDKHAPGEPIHIARLLGIEDQTETELEAAATIGATSYWISSHCRTKHGKLDTQRQFFFALQFKSEQGKLQPKLLGSPCKTLLSQIISEPRLNRFQLEDLSVRKDENRAPKTERGFNIEGLAANPDGGLLIALRGPLIANKALLIPLKNPDELLNGKKAIFGDPIFLDLGGLGVRSIEYVDRIKKFIVVGGRTTSSGPSSKLFEWNGKSSAKPTALSFDLSDLNPEALVVQNNCVLILSDDGGQSLDGRDCKDLEKEGKPVYFRGKKLRF